MKIIGIIDLCEFTIYYIKSIYSVLGS